MLPFRGEQLNWQLAENKHVCFWNSESYRKPGNKMVWRKFQTFSVYDICLGLVWTAIKGGNISFTRAQWENIRLQKKKQKILQSQNGLRSQQTSVALRPYSSLQSFLQNDQSFFCSFFASCSWQIFDTVNDHSGYWKPSATNNLQYSRVAGWSVSSPWHNKRIFPLQELTVIDSYSDCAIHTQW